MDIAENPHEVSTRKLYSFEHVALVNITLQQGESLKKHITPVDGTFFGFEGASKVEISNEIQDLKKCDLVFSPKDIIHRLFNESDSPFKFFVIKTPTASNQKTVILWESINLSFHEYL